MVHWSRDGQKLYYRTVVAKETAIVERDVHSGSEREVIRRANLNFSIDLSPDGRHLAAASEDPASKSSAVMFIPVAGGEPREMIRVSHPQNFQVMTWVPDGHAFSSANP